MTNLDLDRVRRLKAVLIAAAEPDAAFSKDAVVRDLAQARGPEYIAATLAKVEAFIERETVNEG